MLNHRLKRRDAQLGTYLNDVPRTHVRRVTCCGWLTRWPYRRLSISTLIRAKRILEACYVRWIDDGITGVEQGYSVSTNARLAAKSHSTRGSSQHRYFDTAYSQSKYKLVPQADYNFTMAVQDVALRSLKIIDAQAL